MKIALVVPHIFAQQKILERTIFAPIHLALDLADELSKKHEVFLFTPGKVKTKAKNINVDLSHLNAEIKLTKQTLSTFITENPLSFISIARQIHTELTVKAFEYANSNKVDIVHVYMCEDETPLYFANFVKKPILFTHHDPYNFYRKYRTRFPILKNLNYISISLAQRQTAPEGMNFIANIRNGVKMADYKFVQTPDDYFASLGRIVRVKGVHNAIDACKKANVPLRIAGKYYVDSQIPEESYWDKFVKPHIDNKKVFYDKFLQPPKETSRFLGHAKALLFPVEWDEPFGMVMIEALACGTPVIAYPNGAVPEIIKNGENGFLVNSVDEMTEAIKKIDSIDRAYCRKSVESRFSIEMMVNEYEKVYEKLSHSQKKL